MKEENAIEVNGLGKHFTKVGTPRDTGSNGLWALRNVSFEVKRGDSVGIFGQNGSGKSTLLKILAGVTRPTEGTVSMRGRVASVLDIGAGFHPELSGRKNIYLNSSILGFGKREVAQVEKQIIDYSGIAEFIDEPVKNFSSGMFLRLAFSIVMHLDFDVYLFDEVFSVGDAKFEAKANKSLQALASSDKTVVLVSHQMGAIDKQNKLLHLEHGALRSFGENRQVLVDYLTESVVQADVGIDIITTDHILTAFDEKKEVAELRLCEVGLSQPDNKTSEFRTDKEFHLNIIYEKLDSQCTLDCLVTLRDLQDNVLLFTSPLVAHSPSKQTASGIYEVTCVIPSSMLNSRLFSIDLSVLKNVHNSLSSYGELNNFSTKDLLGGEGIELCATFNKILCFKPVYCSGPVTLDLSKFQISCNFVTAFNWKLKSIEKYDTTI